MAENVPGCIQSFEFESGLGVLSSEALPGEEVIFETASLPAELQDGIFDDSFIQLTGRNVFFHWSTGADGMSVASDINFAFLDEQDQLVGTVKSFNEKKGYGFITSASVPGDIYFQLKHVPPHLQGGLVGQAIRFSCHMTPDGKPQANKVALKAAHAGGCNGGYAPAAGYAPPAAAHAPHYTAVATAKGAPRVHAKGFAKGGAPKGGYAGGPYAHGMPRGMQMMGKGSGMMGRPAGPKGMMGKGAPAIARPPAMAPMLQYARAPQQAVAGVAQNIGICKTGQSIETSSSGVVKSFAASKGWGFIQSPDLPGEDIYFKLADPISPGTPVRFVLKQTPDGRAHGTHVQSAFGGQKRPVAGLTPDEKRLRGPADPFAGPEIVECWVKSYKTDAGWGFLQSNQIAGDIYFQRKQLSQDLQQQILAGMLLDGRVGQVQLRWTPDGMPQAASVQIW